MNQVKQSFHVFELKEGRFREAAPVELRSTLFGALWGPDKACLVRVERPGGENRLERQRARLQAISALQRGHEGFYPLGSGNGAKEGRFWFATKDVLKAASPYFSAAEDAAAYGGVLFSENNHGIYRVDNAKVNEVDGADGMGYVDADWLRQQGEEEIAYAVSTHFTAWGIEPKSPMDKALLACDELAGFVMACCLVRPDGIASLKPKSVKKKLKDKAFAAKVNRDEIRHGFELLGVEPDEHIAFMIEALKPHAEELGIAGSGR